MKYFLPLLLALCLSVKSSAYVSPFGASSYLGLGGGFALAKGTGASLNGSQNDGLYYCKAKSFAMSFALTKLYGGDDSKFHFGYYIAGIIGGYSSDWYIIHTDAGDRTIYWQDGFDFLGHMSFGLQGAYSLNEKDMVIGLRYFNNYSGDGMRAAWDNSDDAACAGVFLGTSKIGLDVSYASDKIPGVLVSSYAWEYVMTDLRYCITTWDDDMMTFYAGVHYEHSIMVDPESLLSLDGKETGSVNSFLFTVGIGVNGSRK